MNYTSNRFSFYGVTLLVSMLVYDCETFVGVLIQFNHLSVTDHLWLVECDSLSAELMSFMLIIYNYS